MKKINCIKKKLKRQKRKQERKKGPNPKGMYCINPLCPKSDQHLISPHNINNWSNKQVMRIQEMITKDEMFDFLRYSPN